MVASMTSFARSAIQAPWGQAVWEIRSVNHRYLELGFKIPEPFREWENSWRQLAAGYVQRGKVDCFLSFSLGTQMLHTELNLPLVTELLSHCQALAQQSQVDPTVPALALLQWPEVLKTPPQDYSAIQQPLTTLLENAFAALLKGRKNEGAQLQQILLDKMRQSFTLVQAIQQTLPESMLLQRKQLLDKLEALQLKVDPQRLEQEVVMLIQRADMTEEVDRLLTHLGSLKETLALKEPIGRRLDFLMQEMNREANTLGAKAVETRVIQMAIELKVLIEQMREQIQNVE